MFFKVKFEPIFLTGSLAVLKELNPAIRFGFARQKFQAQTLFELNPIYPAKWNLASFRKELSKSRRLQN